MINSWRSDKHSSNERGYGAAWQRAREQFLRSSPLCVMCSDEGKTTAATLVDHIKPHRGDAELFWDQSNWQPLCKPHHDSDKARIERGSRVKAKFNSAGRLIW